MEHLKAELLDPIYQDYLFDKHILVGDEACPREASEAFATVFALARMFGIRITSGKRLAHEGLIELAARKLGRNVPQPFYRGFPESVRALTSAQLLFDQLLEYAVSYGMNDFSGEGHSVFEEDFERIAFQESGRTLEFRIVSVEEAKRLTAESVEALLCSTRPLQKDHFELVKAFILENSESEFTHCACKDTAIKLLLATGDLSWLRFLHLSDGIAIVDELNYEWNDSMDLKKMNLKNRQRKFISQILDWFFENGQPSIKACYEKKALWSGILHHIHYRPKNEAAEQFVAAGRQDLADNELAEAAVMERYLPKQLSEAEVEEKVKEIIAQVGATSIKDMGKVMGAANKALAGLSDGRTISTIVKKLLA